MKPTPDARTYWRRNLRYLFILLSIWFTVSYGCGILFVDELDSIRIGGFKLGFWFAQQGSIYVFVILIFVYVWLMNRLDRSFVRADVSAEEQADIPSARAVHVGDATDEVTDDVAGDATDDVAGDATDDVAGDATPGGD